MESIIYLTPTEESGSFTNLSFYSVLLKKLSEHYQTNSEKPVLSIEKIEWIEPSSIPNLVSLGIYLKQFHKEPIELRINYNPRLLHYLEHVGFFKLVGKKSSYLPDALEIYEFDNRYIGGFSAYNIKEKRKEHKIRCYFPEIEYSTISSLYEKETFRDNLIERLESYILPEHFGTVLEDKEITRDNIYETFERLAEPISNGILHSKSPTIVLVQTTKFNTKISISDAGIGFENSFVEKNLKFDFIDILKEKSLYDINLHDFYFILQILFYSTCKFREGFTDFIIDVILINNGIVRIHYNSTQVILTTSLLNQIQRLKTIREEVNKYLMINKLDVLPSNHNLYTKVFKTIFDISDTIKNSYKSILKVSPLRLFDVNFKGVHIEIDLM